VANLAAGEVEASAAAGEAAWERMKAQPELAAVNVIPLADVALARGDLAAARRLADDAVTVAPGMHLLLALAKRARVAIAQNDFDRAACDARDALTGAGDLKGYYVVPDALECLAVIAAGRGADREAARLFGAAQAVRARTGYVRFKIYDADYDASVAALREAMGEDAFHDTWTEGESLSIDEAITYALRGRGERKRPATGWNSLTPAELNVVRLVSEGLSNKDIASRLFLSTRTVQAHLSHVYSKLAISSRVQLAQEAARHA
jgi:DNA-binding NarL/FixJ family response regulator